MRIIICLPRKEGCESTTGGESLRAGWSVRIILQLFLAQTDGMRRCQRLSAVLVVMISNSGGGESDRHIERSLGKEIKMRLVNEVFFPFF